MKPEFALNQSELYEALSIVHEQIEELGASSDFTNLSVMMSDIRHSIGNEFNQPNYYSAERVRKTIRENEFKKEKQKLMYCFTALFSHFRAVVDALAVSEDESVSEVVADARKIQREISELYPEVKNKTNPNGMKGAEESSPEFGNRTNIIAGHPVTFT